MQAIVQVGSDAAVSYSNWNSILSSKITHCALSALAWSVGLGSSCILASTIAPIASIGLFLSIAAAGILANGYFLLCTSHENCLKKINLVALSTFFYLGGFLACGCLTSTYIGIARAAKSIATLDAALGLNAVTWTMITIGFTLPGAVKMNLMGINVLSGINTPLQHVPLWIENITAWLPKYMRHLVLAHICLHLENEGFKSFLLRLEDYKITLQEILDVLDIPDKIELFWNKCKKFESDVGYIVNFCKKLENNIKEVNSSIKAEELMQMVSRHAKSAQDLLNIFSLLNRNAFLQTQIDLSDYYNQFLKNSETNKYLPRLKAKLQVKEEDEDDTPSYEILGFLMSTEQCKKYLIQLDIPMEEEGPIFTFQKVLEKNDLGTLAQLKEAKLYPLKEDQKTQQILLLAALQKKQPSSKNAALNDTLRKIVFLIKRIFIETVFWTSRLLSFLTDPWFFAAGFTHGLMFPNHTYPLTTLLVPNAESILYSDDTFQGVRSFVVGILLNGMRGMSGFLTASAILRLQRIAHRTIRSF
jgi:hypothetical protein